MCRTPFPLQPFITDVPSLLAWYAGGSEVPRGTRVETLRVVTATGDARSRFEPEIDLHIYKVAPGAVTAAVTATGGQGSGLAAALRLLGIHSLGAPSVGTAGLFATGEGRWGLDAHAPARFAISIPDQASELELAYGIREGAYTGEGATDGVLFRVLARGEGGDPVVLFERELTPISRPEDRGTQRSAIPLPDARDGLDEIVLETTRGPAGDGAWDWAYWEDVRFRAP